MDHRRTGIREIGKDAGAGLLLLALLTGLPLPVAAAPGGPTLTTITLDGNFDDWTPVLVNPVNVTRDGYGTTVSCGASDDCDCPVAQGERDLKTFAYTWDATNLYVYWETYEAPAESNPGVLVLFCDMDRDGVLSPNHPSVLDWALKVKYDGAERDVEVLAREEYVPDDPAGDPLTGGSCASSDGYGPPGGFNSTSPDPPVPPVCDTCADAAGVRFEAAIPWSTFTMLGYTVGQPLLFHVSTAEEDYEQGDSLADNLGGPNGAIGDLGFAAHAIAADQSRAAGAGTTVEFGHTLTNTGNLDDTINLWLTSARGWKLTLFEDVNGNGIADDGAGAIMGIDANGDGDFLDPGDQHPSLNGYDSDGDDRPNPGLLAGGTGVTPGAAFNLVLQVEVPAGIQGQTETAEIRTVSTTNAACTEAVTDTVAVGAVVLTPDRGKTSASDAAGTLLVHFPHALSNLQAGADTFDLTASCSQAWTHTFFTDPNGDGDPADGTPITSLALAAGETQSLVFQVTVPPGLDMHADPAVQDVCTLTATSQAAGAVTDSATDTTTIRPWVQVIPDHTAANGGARYAGPGTPVFYGHTLINNADVAMSYDLSGSSDAGCGSAFSRRFFSDPDGDGSPADGTDLGITATVGPLAASGGRYPFVARIDVAAAATPGCTDATSLFAVMTASPFQLDSADDRTLVSQVVSYADAACQLQRRYFAPCDPVHALGLQLQANTTDRYRLQWTDPLLAVARRTVLTTDAQGEGTDCDQSICGDPLGNWELKLQECQGGGWTSPDTCTGTVADVDTIPFTVENQGTVAPLGTGQGTYEQSGETLTVHAQANNTNFRAAFTGTTLRFVVLTPAATVDLAGGQYLRPDGTFAAYTGAEWTRTVTGVDVPAGGAATDLFSVASVSFPAQGTGYQLHARWEQACTPGPCGGASCALLIDDGAATFTVENGDTDGDGLLGLAEASHGTDPKDADTDDDGLSDGEEVNTTLTAPLVADSDGDGLNDGTEAGKTDPGGPDTDGDGTPDALDPDPDEETITGTDVGAANFVADQDPVTTTDPAVADTDGGGVDDGVEDGNRNGRRDDGERDPTAGNGGDDGCTPGQPAALGSISLHKSGDDLVLTWPVPGDFDPACDTYTLLYAVNQRPPDEEDDFVVLASGLASPTHTHVGAVSAGDGNDYQYLVIRRSSLSTLDGSWEHYSK